MGMKFFAFCIFLISMTVGCIQSPQQEYAMSPNIDNKVDSLMSIMTLEEKIGQLNLYSGSWEITGPVPADNYSQQKAENIRKGMVGGMLNVFTAKGTREAQKLAVENSRLKIPLIFGYDVVHGYKTMLPIPLAQAASWNAEVARRGAEVAAKEAAASGLHWTFSPMIDISRDARWGRIMEGAGEDPYLTSVMAKAWVEGYQGKDLSDPFTIAACAKHFAAYGFAETGRDYNTVDISNQTLYNVVLPPFKAAIDAGAVSVMNAFNEVGGIPATGHRHLQRDILKGTWGFKGLVVSDWASINEMVTHGYTPDIESAALAAISAGSDMDMESRIYETELIKLINSGKVNVSLIDDAARRILRVKFQLGLFDDPYKYCDEEREKATLLTDEHIAAARDAGRKSIVLLKNDGILPLSSESGSIGVIGQLAESKDVPLGSWRAQANANSAVSVLEGIQGAIKNKAAVRFAQGYTLTTGRRTFINELTIVEGDKSGFNAAIQLANSVETVVIAMGEDCFQTGEGRSQADIGLKGNQEELLAEILKVNKNVVVVMMTGRPVAIPYTFKNARAVVQAWYLGQAAGDALADVLFGAYNPSGKLPVSFPYHVGQEPLYYNKKNTGRPITNDFDDGLVFWSHYTDVPNEALIPFGFGLSYTTFIYTDLSVKSDKGTIDVSVRLQNTGKRTGTETVQLYIRDIHASETQPIKRLVAFKQVALDAGSDQLVEFKLTEKELGFYHSDFKFFAEDGEFQVMVGGNSRDLVMEKVKVRF